jgi:UDP-GlcNAc:undecaprenyl-phosphate GlcNAc-1-phosphate transferase
MAAAGAFCLSIAFVQILRGLALRYGVLLDQPSGGRKAHQAAIPVVGGLAIFLAIGLAGLGTLDFITVPSYMVVLAAGASLLLLGGLDDSRDLPAKSKLLWQLLIVTGAVLAAELPVSELWGAATHSPLLYGLALFIVVMGITGYLNAINMVDGADGLAGGVMLIAALYLAASCAYVGNTRLAAILLVLAGGLMGFLSFNFRRPGLPRASVFMGDAGTLSLGFLLAWCAAVLAGHNPPAALWLLAYPVLDLTAVSARRMKAGHSPFRADRGHLHHLLLDSGLPHPLMLATVFGINAAFGLVGMLGVMGLIPAEALWAGVPVLAGLYLAIVKNLPDFPRRTQK